MKQIFLSKQQKKVLICLPIFFMQKNKAYYVLFINIDIQV